MTFSTSSATITSIQRHGPATCASASQSTLSSRDSAFVSEMDHVCPSLFAAIKDHETCTVENLLNGMLSLCLPEDHKHNPITDLLDQCLNAVLPICNDCQELRDHLTEYGQRKSNEIEGCGPLIYAFNYALRALHEIEVPLRESTRKPTDLLLFHRNNPELITAAHHGHISQRKPDIVLVSLDVAGKTYSDGDEGGWAKYALNKAAELPPNGFKWRDSFSAVEIRRNREVLPTPSKMYTVKPAKAISPQHIPSRCEDLPTREESSREMIPSSDCPHSVHVVSQSCNSSLSDASSNRKRKSEHRDAGPKKKVKMLATSRRSIPMLQSALYAAERMSDAIWIRRAVNLVITDTVAHVWWYDNEGAIQSHGIDFIEDLPHFLVLLLCFKRFTLKDWGLIPEFKPAGQEAVLSFPPRSLSTLEISTNQTNKIRGHFGIVGRATQMLHAISQSKDPRDGNKSLEGVDLVVKVYWAESSRIGEAEIEKAQEIAQQNDDVKGHLPDLIHSHDFVEYSTKEIRTAFGIETETNSDRETDTRCHRVLRIMLFRRLHPITDLVGGKFWTAFWDCFRCHYRLWVGGVEHNDISVNNLMYDKLNADRGVLNDYDLAHLNGRTRPSGTEHTGTMPFMAFDVLRAADKNSRDKGSKFTRVYRHDCESFAWVLLWICCRYDGGKEISHPPLSDLITDSVRQCFVMKNVIHLELEKITPTPSYEPFGPFAINLISDLEFKHHTNQLRAYRRVLKTRVAADAAARQRPIDEGEGEPPGDEEEPPRVFEYYRKALEEFDFNDLSKTI